MRLRSGDSLVLGFGLLLCATAAAQQHSYSASDVEAGAHLYRSHCAVCHGQEGDQVPGINLAQSQFRRVKEDDELMRVINAGVPGTAMPPHNFNNPELWALVAYIRTMRDFRSGARTSGDAARGQALFAGKGGCFTCHRVGPNGSRLGPDLSDIGIIRPAAHIERSIIEPNETILPRHRSIRAVSKDGTVVVGRRLNEDTHTIQILDANDRLISLSKDDLKEYGVMKTSSMPSYRDKLSTQELADIVAYLTSLKGVYSR